MKGRFVCMKCGETMGNKFSTGNKVCRKCNPFPTVKKAEIGEDDIKIFVKSSLSRKWR